MGAVYSIGRDGSGYTVLHTFGTTHTNNVQYFTNLDGAVPGVSLVLSGDTLFGTTSSGGTNGTGTLFSINTNGTAFTVLHTFRPDVNIGNGAFTNADGAGPRADFCFWTTNFMAQPSSAVPMALGRFSR